MPSHFRIDSAKRILSGAAMAILLAVCADANAGLIGFDNRATFNLAIAGWSTTSTNFEATPVNTQFGAGTGPAGSGFSLTLAGPDAPAMSPTVSDQFWTTSGTHYLGLDNPDTAFEAGDSLIFNFTSGKQAFGLFVIGGRDVGAGDITLTAGGATVANRASADMTDGNGSFAYFVGFVSDDASTFNSVTLNNLTLQDVRLLAIAVDDVVLGLNDGQGNPSTDIPEPGTLMLSLFGMLALGAATRRRAGAECGRQVGE